MLSWNREHNADTPKTSEPDKHASSEVILQIREISMCNIGNSPLLASKAYSKLKIQVFMPYEAILPKLLQWNYQPTTSDAALHWKQWRLMTTHCISAQSFELNLSYWLRGNRKTCTGCNETRQRTQCQHYTSLPLTCTAHTLLHIPLQYFIYHCCTSQADKRVQMPTYIWWNIT